MKQIALWIVIAASVLLAEKPARCEPPLIPVNATMRSEDARLEIPVTMSEPRIYLGELLKKMTKQTGIALDTPLNDTASGTPITIYLNKTPLASVMNALWSLVSYQHGVWEWERVGEKGAYRYRLSRPLSAKEFAARFRGELKAVYLKRAELMMRMAKMSPDERKAHVSELSAALLQTDDTAAQRMTQDNTIYEPHWQALRVFQNDLTAEQRTNVLESGGTIAVPFDQLSEEGKDHLRKSASNGYMINANGDKVPYKVPSEIVVEGNSVEFGNTLAIRAGEIIEMPLSLPYGTEAKQLLVRWLLPGDSKTDHAESKTISAPSDYKLGSPDPLSYSAYKALAAANKTPSRQRVIEKRLEQMANAMPVSLIALLPFYGNGFNSEDDPKLPYGKTLTQFLESLVHSTYQYMHKWRDGVLLISDPSWLSAQDTYAPFQIVKNLREHLEPDGFYKMKTLAPTAAALNDGQLEALCSEFPVLQNMIGHRELFDLYTHYPDALRPNGTPWNAAMTAQFPEIAKMIDSDKEIGTIPIEAVRFVRSDQTAGNRLIRAFLLYGRQEIDHKTMWVLITEFEQVHESEPKTTAANP